MRIIYLSASKDKGDFCDKKKAIEFFMKYINGQEKYFDYNHTRIDKKKFGPGEDIIFLRPAKNQEGHLTYEIIAYCQSASGVLYNNNPSSNYQYYFEVDTKTVKLFRDGIDVEFLNEFLCHEKINGITKDNFLTDNIKDDKFAVSHSWTHFNKEDGCRIMNKLKAVIFERYNVFKQYQ